MFNCLRRPSAILCQPRRPVALLCCAASKLVCQSVCLYTDTANCKRAQSQSSSFRRHRLRRHPFVFSSLPSLSSHASPRKGKARVMVHGPFGCMQHACIRKSIHASTHACMRATTINAPCMHHPCLNRRIICLGRPRHHMLRPAPRTSSFMRIMARGKGNTTF